KKEQAIIEKNYKRARLYFRKKKYSKAVEMLKEIIAENPAHSKARKLLAKAEKKEAEGIFLRNKTKSAGDRKGRPYAEEKRIAAKKAETPAVKTAGLTKKEIRELYKKGELAFKAGKYKEAIDCFMQVLIAEPGSRKAGKYIKMSAEEILRPRIEEINKQRQAMVFDARTLIFARQKKYDVGALYAAAVKNYKKRYYLRASDKLRQIMEVSEGYKDTEKYFSLIESKMYKNSEMGIATDAETLSYAQGYLKWWAKKIQPAVNEWEKCLALNPRNKEVKEYHGKAKEILEMASRKEYQAEIEAKLKAVFKQGEKLCKKKKYVDAIKKYEKVITISEETPISTSLKWSADARLRIEYALDILKKMTAKVKKKKKKQVEEKKAEVIDVKSAQRHYTSGLVAYAQGRLREAIREWDLSLRLNPGHEKARLARRKAKKELGYE
ncbi:MAG: tetratricopeptide repeat protein, partial [Elusimicrobia bacterium]|nr:tetratricopeptide repeat protein [Elusimicrobiota bacterium]